MKVMTPSISWHNRERISSIDFQPQPWPLSEEVHEGQSPQVCRMASSGDDQHVVIWHVQFDAEGKFDFKCLCDLSRHQNAVNIVRWSKNGKILASGDTDNAIFLWHYNEKGTIPDIFADENSDANSDAGISENWTAYKTLRGHLQDVVGLDFSPCGNYLASCSTDSTTIIFDVNKGSKLKILSESKGWVNGVAWDPLEKFVTTIASDRVLRFYKTKTFKSLAKTYKCKLSLGIDSETGNRMEEKTVRLFHDDTFPSFYRRLAFSPDGQIIVVPSGVLDIDGEAKVEHCTYVFTRTNMAKPALYLPNKEFSVAARFSPIKYKLRNVPQQSGDDSNSACQTEEKLEEIKPWDKVKTLFKLPYRMIYAVASQNTVTLYDTQQSEPFARISKIHYIGLTDLSWSADGKVLVISSSDGFCSIVTFNDGELGEEYQVAHGCE